MRRQPAERRVRGGRGVCQSRQRGVEGGAVAAHPLEGVVGGQLPGDHERPVARLDGKQLPGGTRNVNNYDAMGRRFFLGANLRF